MADPSAAFTVGVDIGGTFTDAVVRASDGSVTVGKVSTTPTYLEQGFFGSIADAAAKLGLGTSDLLARTARLGHGTTVGINALVTGAVADTALIASRGHGDAIRAMAGTGRSTGANLEELLDFSVSHRAVPLLGKDRVFEVNERIDRDGDVIVHLQHDDVMAAIGQLRALDVASIAVSFLWSHANPRHEKAVGDLLAELCPGTFVSLSHQVAPSLGEYQRTVSTVMNAQVGPLMVDYIAKIVEGAAALGYQGDVLFAHGEGGLVPADVAARHPLITIQSGPVAGVMGSAVAGRRMGWSNIIVADMGGTTFDVSAIRGGAVRYSEDNQVIRQRLHLRKIDIESIGAGGGSIAWVHEQSGSLRVGPRSAGAVPGPVCYGLGGTEVTVTDADLVLGVLDPQRPLAGKVALDVAKARDAVERLGARVGLGVEACASGIVEIVDSQMEDLIRRATLQRGHDPKEFVIFAYGGASGAHAGLYGAGVGVERIVFPMNDVASVWSAYGLGSIEHSRTFRAPTFLRTPFDAGEIGRTLRRLGDEASAYADAHRIADPVLVRTANLKFTMQIFDVETPLPEGEVTDRWCQELLATFTRSYEERYGAGTGYADAGAEITALRVTVSEPRLSDAGLAQTHDGSLVRAGPDRTRDVYWREFRSWRPTDVFDGLALRSGARIEGPAIVDLPNTTIVARPGQQVDVDAFGNLVLSFGGER